eukprot:tig00000093_g3591.t1
MPPKRRAKPKSESESDASGASEEERQPKKRAARARAAPAAKPKAKAAAKERGAGADAGEPSGPRFFLMKSEPESRIEDGHDVKFSLEDLKAKEGQTSCWDGVRNYQARNIMRSMRIGDQAFFYHSNCKEPGCVGIVEVVKEAYPDHTQFDPKSPYYDAKSTREDPKWSMVDVKFVRELKRLVSLKEIKADPELASMELVGRGRLSVQRVAPAEWAHVLALSQRPAP